MNMKLLAVVTPLYIYCVCSNQKKFWEGNFTLGDFTPVNIKNCGLRNVRKHRDIKNGDKYTTLDISLKFGSMYKMRITSSKPKYYLGRSRKGLITSMGLITNVRAKKKKARYNITNVSMKDLSNIIRDFEKFPFKGNVQKRPKHELTDS